jgi:hypothetical protein
MSIGNNQENLSTDLDKIKRQLLDDQQESLKQQSDNNIIKIKEQELKHQIHNDDFIEYVVKIVKKTVKCEDILIRQILYTSLSSYIEDDPINLGILAPTSEGKTYPVEECIKFFHRDDIIKVGSMSAKVLIRDKGVLVDKNLNSIENKLKELKKRAKALSKKNQKEEKEQINEEIEKLYKDARTLIDLRGKILVFLEPPKKDVWDILKPILSHDSPEIEFPFVNKTDKEGHETKDVVVRGWPSCIFCSAKDESKWEVWPEIKSRFLISSPNMIPQKYKESTKLISQKIGKPNLIQQEVIISDIEIENAKKCILLLKQKINELKLKNNNGKISLWIPYAEILEKELPSNKGTDVRLQKRIFSLLRIVPIIKSNHRKLIVLGNETSVIADLEDLREVLSITQNFEGIPKYKIEFFINVFYPCYKAKDDVPDSSKDTLKQEERVAVTARQLCDAYKKVKGKSITTDNLKKTYLDELMSNGLIDYDKSNIDAKQYIYYPIVDPLSSAIVEVKEESLLSLLSNSEPFYKVSQYSSTIYEKTIKKINETWLFCEIIKLLSYRINLSNIQSPLADYLNNHEELQLLDNNNCYSDNVDKKEIQSIVSEDNMKELNSNSQIEKAKECCCCNNINNNTNGSRLRIRQFIKKYIENPKTQFDIKQSSNIASFGNISQIESNLSKFDIKDN